MWMSSHPGAQRLGSSIVCVLLVVLAPACAAKRSSSRPTDTHRSRPSSASSATASTPLPPLRPSAVVCNGDNDLHEDDDSAVRALLLRSQLPSGAWTRAETSPCPWALSADELLAVPECRRAATAAHAKANDKIRNGNAHVTFNRSGVVQLDDRIEIYTSRQNEDALRANLASRSMPACYSAALRRRAAEAGMTVGNVSVSRFAVLPDAAALHLGFPAAAGYAADTGFAIGVDLGFTRKTEGSTKPVAMHVITFGSGGLMSTLTLIGASAADLAAVDLTVTLRHAAKNFRAMYGAG